MKYQKLHKVNSKKKKNGNLCRPAEEEEDDKHMIRSNEHGEYDNNDNISQQKVRIFSRAINRIVSMTRGSGENNNYSKGGLQLQNSPPTTTYSYRSSSGSDGDDEQQQRTTPHHTLTGLDQLDEDFKTSTIPTSAIAPGRNMSFYQLDEDFKNIHDQQQTPVRKMGFYSCDNLQKLEEDSGKFKNHHEQQQTPPRCLSFDQLEEDFEKLKNGSYSATPRLFKSRIDA